MSLKASIIGVSGYTGLELLRMCIAHPEVELAHVTSRQNEGEKIGDVFPHLKPLDLCITNPEPSAVAKDSDVVFLALPHKTAQDVVAELHGEVKVIDLSADYRLNNVKTYERYYQAHKHAYLLKDVVYGAPEITGRDTIAAASTVANPGCFALLVQLMLFPFRGAIKHADVIAVTGSSGSGKSASDGTHHPIRSHNMKSYNINKHRHIAEIIRSAEISEDQLNFVPTSGPFVRGIFAQAFLQLDGGDISAFENAYKDAPFVRMQDEVTLANIVGSNYCDLSVQAGQNGTVLVQGALDNLVKGAAGNAVQNMNLMFGLDETTGLKGLSPVYP